MTEQEIMKLETAMWDTAKRRDTKGFLSLVSDKAVMVCGGYTCTGREYSGIISEFDCKDYKITNFGIVAQDDNYIQVHYVIELSVNDPENSDLAGSFHITTTWEKLSSGCRIVFNMDSKLH